MFRIFKDKVREIPLGNCQLFSTHFRSEVWSVHMNYTKIELKYNSSVTKLWEPQQEL